MNLIYIRAVFVGRLAHVDAGVLGESVQNVQCDKTEVIHRPETVTYSSHVTVNVNRNAIRRVQSICPQDTASASIISRHDKECISLFGTLLLSCCPLGIQPVKVLKSSLFGDPDEHGLTLESTGGSRHGRTRQPPRPH